MKARILIICIAAILSTACGTQKHITRSERYPGIYAERPHVILVMPPINQTSNIEAKDLLYGSVSRPFAEKGYYVIPPILALDILKNESAYDSENFVETPLGLFNQYFGADAVVFSEIKKWNKSAAFGIETTIRYFIKSTKTNEILFDRTCELHLSTGERVNGGGLFGVVASLAISAVKTIVTDHIDAAREANQFIFSDLPYGKYSEMYGKDKEKIAGEEYIKKRIKK